MQKIVSYIIYGILFTGLIFLVYLSFIIIRTDYSSNIPQEKVCEEKPEFNLINHLGNWDKNSPLTSFPYSIYLDSVNYCDIQSIQKNLVLLDSLNPGNSSVNQHVIAIALTDSLWSKIDNSLINYNPDSLILLVQWAEKFNHYKDYDLSKAKLYRVIYKFWTNVIANQLRTYYDNKPNHKYDFKFNYLTAICQSKNLAPPIGNTDFEKIIHNLINKNFSYLFSKFWHDTGVVYKLIVLIFGSVTVYGYYRIFKFITKTNVS